MSEEKNNVIINFNGREYKNILIEAFHKTLPVEEEEVIEEE